MYRGGLNGLDLQTCTSQTRPVLVIRARRSTPARLPALSGSWSMRPCHLSPMPTLLWRVLPQTCWPCPLCHLASIPGSHVEEAPVCPASTADHLPCPCSVRSHHGDCVQGPGSALARNAELAWTICAKRACHDPSRHTQESVVVHRMAAPVTWRVDRTHDSPGTHGPSQGQSVLRAPGRRSAALAQSIPEHTSPHTSLVAGWLPAWKNGRFCPHRPPWAQPFTARRTFWHSLTRLTV